jgi:hypothetical protein
MDVQAIARIVVAPKQSERLTVSLLKAIGVPNELMMAKKTVRNSRINSSFWFRPVNHLEILERAKSLWRQQIVKAHPDRPGGNAELAILLNRAWDLIEKRFREHGFELGK